MRFLFISLLLFALPAFAFSLSDYARNKEAVVNSQSLSDLIRDQKTGTLIRVLMVRDDGVPADASALLASADFQACERKAFRTLKEALEESPERALFQSANPALHLQFRDYRQLTKLGYIAQYIDPIFTSHFSLKVAQFSHEQDQFLMGVDVYGKGVCTTATVGEIRKHLQEFAKAIDSTL